MRAIVLWFRVFLAIILGLIAIPVWLLSTVLDAAMTWVTDDGELFK
jgi:hypothetical protein